MTSTDIATSAPASPSAMPRLDLRRPPQRSVVDIVVRPSAVASTLRTHTCPQCGLNPAGPPVKRTFNWVPSWVYLGLLINIVVLLILYGVGRKVVKGELTLCADCDAADRRGRTIRSVSVAGLVLGPALFGTLGAMAAGGDGAMIGALIGLVAGIAGIVASHRQTRLDVIGVKHLDPKKDTMTLTASPSFATVLLAEAPDALVR